MCCGSAVVAVQGGGAPSRSSSLHSRTSRAQLPVMKKLGKDFLMFAEALGTRGFRRDLAFTMVIPLLVALLYFEARSDFEVALVWCLFIAALLWFPWYAL